ncbi:hypothetical protein P0Y35_06610 [Kiritimatiellaeota bacterium B1221]|nr:hypothetical protein [Kiritimatiellaeota bacterium B1221]
MRWPYVAFPEGLEAESSAELEKLMEEVSSPVVMPHRLPGRTPAARKAAIEKYGGVERFPEPAVSQALDWLKDHQQNNGAWHADGRLEEAGEVLSTSLALLAFLTHGETPASAKYGPTVGKGLRYLFEHQDENGSFQPAEPDSRIGQAVATYAWAQAYLMTENILMREPLKRGVKMLGMQIKEFEGEKDDLSKYWQVRALSSASRALRGDPEAGKLLQQVVDEMLLPGDGQGNEPENKSFLAGKAISLYLARRTPSEAFRESIQFLEKYTQPESLPQWGKVNTNAESEGEILFWYLAVNAFFAEDPSGENFRLYMPALVKALVLNQAEDGQWMDGTESGKRLGSVGNTSLAALSLMVYYQSYSLHPVYVPVPGEKDAEIAPKDIDFELFRLNKK